MIQTISIRYENNVNAYMNLDKNDLFEDEFGNNYQLQNILKEESEQLIIQDTMENIIQIPSQSINNNSVYSNLDQHVSQQILPKIQQRNSKESFFRLNQPLYPNSKLT